MNKLFPDLPIIVHKQDETIANLKAGEIDDLRVSNQLPIDDIVKFGLREGFLKEGLKSFPDQRKGFDIPIEVLLLPQVIQRLDDEHSLLLAPYMLNSAELLTELGFSARVLEEGFNDKNKYKRTAPFHGETLKHALLSIKVDQLLNWFNTDWNELMKSNAPGRTKQYIIDGTEIHVPAHLYKKFDGAGVVKNNDGELSYGYKVVWIQEIIDRKGVIRSMKIAPINAHDLPLGKELIADFNFEEGSLLLMDRGFLDGAWITDLKNNRKIDVCMPLKSNSEITQFAVAQAEVDKKWTPHPTRDGQKIHDIKKSELEWSLCQCFNSGVLVRFMKKNGEEENIAFVDTRVGISGKTILATYDQRAEIEETHRQMKCFQGMEKLPSKKLVHIVFRIVMGTIAYNLFNLFLNSEKCATLKDYTLKTHRQRRRSEERNPDIIIYTGDTYAILKNLDFLDLILALKKSTQLKLRKIFKELTS